MVLIFTQISISEPLFFQAHFFYVGFHIFLFQECWILSIIVCLLVLSFSNPVCFLLEKDIISDFSKQEPCACLSSGINYKLTDKSLTFLGSIINLLYHSLMLERIILLIAHQNLIFPNSWFSSNNRVTPLDRWLAVGRGWAMVLSCS